MTFSVVLSIKALSTWTKLLYNKALKQDEEPEKNKRGKKDLRVGGGRVAVVVMVMVNLKEMKACLHKCGSLPACVCVCVSATSATKTMMRTSWRCETVRL